MKKSIFFLLALFFSIVSFAQNELLVRQSEKGPYLLHTVAAKENYYSIGRLYHITPKDIESFNGLDMTKGLNVGQEIRIPLNATNFSQSTDKGRAVYYVVGEKEGLYRVSLKNGNVLMANLRKWNKLTNDNITAGKKMIVGYLAPAEELPATVAAVPAEKPKEPVKETVKESIPETKPPVNTRTETKPETTVVTPPPPAPKPVQVAVTDGSGGYFKSAWEKQIRSNSPRADQTSTSGIFKTASGWQDGKYYLLINGVEPGTIVRIINPTNNKAVYAKVLGEMSGIRQNQGYDIRMSNAAASALDISDTEKFVVKVSY